MPIVVSDRSLGILDPQEQIFHKQPGKKFKLSKFFRDDKYSDQQSCFRSYFGYSGADRYSGTIFRFPLRTEECQSAIKPDGVYTAEKVKTTLFQALETEADNVLIFLKRVKSIKLLTKEVHSCYEFSVKIPDEYLEGVRVSNALLSNHVVNREFHQSIKLTVDLFPISTTSGGKVWLVLNLIGFPQSPPTLAQFYSDKKLNYLPWIGIAMETGIREDQLCGSQSLSFTRDWDGLDLTRLIASLLSEMKLRFDVPIEHALSLNSGNLFCFLPTPEHSYLPFHLHGYFALSNDRRRIKWPSRDSDDTDSKWNQLLIEQLAVSAFAIFYRILVACFHHVNPEVYQYRLLGGETAESHSIPSVLVNQGLCQLVDDRIAYSHITGEWIRVDDALFHPIQYSVHGYNSATVRSAIEGLMEFLHKPLVLLPLNVLSLFNKIPALKSTMERNRMTAHLLRQFLKVDSSSSELAEYFECNIATHTPVVLSFILSDLDSSRDDIPNALENIPLLLSASANISSFSIQSITPLYIYKKEMNCLNLFPGTESLFVDTQLPAFCYNFLLTTAQRFFGRINIRDVSALKSDTTLLCVLFKLSLESHFGELTPPVHWDPDCLPLDRDWLKRVWAFISSDPTLASSLGALPLLPKEDLYSVNNQLLPIIPAVNSVEYILCSSDARYSSIENVLVESGAILIHSHRFIECLDNLVVRELPSGLLTLLERNSCILKFFICRLNVCSNPDLFIKLVEVLNNSFSLSLTQRQVIKQLPIFPNMVGGHISLLLSFLRIPDNIRLPGNIQYPTQFLSPDSPTMSILYSKLDIPSSDINLLVRDHMVPFMESLCKVTNSLPTHFHLSKWLLVLLDKLSSECIQFLKLNTIWVADNSDPSISDINCFHKPSQLFEPDDTVLKDLLPPNSRFFPHSKFEAYFHITKKKQLFLTSTSLEDQRLFEEVIDSAFLNFNINLAADNCGQEWKLRFTSLLTFINSCCTHNKLKITPFANALKDNNIVLPLFEIPDGFPTCIPFLGDRALCTARSVVFCTREEVPLIASVRECVALFSTHDKFNALLRNVNCQTSLTCDMILEQLTAICDSTIPENQVSKVHKLLSLIYDSELILNASRLFPNFVYIKHKNTFTEPKFVVNKAPFDLEPFFYSFNALSYSEDAWRLFSKFGACDVPSPQQIFDILQQLFDTQGKTAHTSSFSDLIFYITNYLSERLGQFEYKSLLLLGEDSLLYPAQCCVYRDDNSSVCVNTDINIDGRMYQIVNSRISIKVAEQFGAHSLKLTLLSDDDELYGFCEAAGQHEELTTRLNNILQQYESSIDVFKELVQNADDANANSVKILIDYSSFPSDSLVEHSMRHWQGPALYFYNDAQFTDADYANILKIFGQTKRDNLYKIGKFGLGFNTVYHLTDLPSFVSGKYIYMLDPHKSYIAKSSPKPGLRVDFVKKHDRILLYQDQFSVFDIGLFNCNVFEDREYKGTLFRLPFRSNSVQSQISTETYGDQKIHKLKLSILKEAEASIRFLQNINCIELFERDRQGDILLALRVNKQVTTNPIPDNRSFLSYYSSHFNSILAGAAVEPVTLCQSIVISKELDKNSSSEDFIVSYSSGTNQCREFLSKNNMSHFPFCSIALSTDTLKCSLKPKCQLYCFLPLPITSQYPMFINGYFALDNSRRGLACTEDGNINTSWNKALINDALVNAIICLLKEIRDRTDIDRYYSLWPTANDATLWNEYSNCTALRIIESNAPLFLCDTSDSTEWLGSRECSFLSYAISNLKSIQFEKFFHFVRKFSAKIRFANFAIIPFRFYDREVFSTIINHNNKMYDLSRICREIIFPNLEEIDFENLFLVLQTLVPLAKGVDKPWIVEFFKSKPSIPCGSQLEWEYRYPDQVVNPYSKLAELYDPSDKRTPHPMFTDLFKEHLSPVFEGLIVLNIINKKLPTLDLIDRTTRQTSFQMDRRKKHCTMIIEYLNTSGNRYTESEKQQLIRALINVPFVPVCQNEVYVKMGLQTDIQLTYPNQCYAFDLRFVITPSVYAVSQEFTNYHRFLELFSICTDKSKIGGEMLTSILEILHQHQSSISTLNLTSSVYSIVLSIYELLIEISIKEFPIQSNSIPLTAEGEKIQKLLSDKHWVWHCSSSSFCKISQMVDEGYQKYNSKFLLCFPFSQLLVQQSHRAFFRHLGLQFGMTLGFAIKVINEMKICYKSNPLPEGDIDLVTHLILEYSKYRNTGSQLKYVPSANNVLCLTSELIRDDMPWIAKHTPGNSKFAHPMISILCLYNLNIRSSRNELYRILPFTRMEFGQHEDISTRIENLKRDFPNDSTVLKEFLQNAEDARATEFSVILDYKKDYKTESLCFSEIDQPNWKEYQKSASLLIYNNKPFTAEDLKGIQSVGLGGKQNKQTIGKFGLGFNTVYHLTKSPCLLTKRKVNGNYVIVYCVFDPYRDFLKLDRNEPPGIRLEFNQEDFMNFSDQFEPFLICTSCLDLSAEFTLFRIPFLDNRNPKSVERELIAEFLQQASSLTLFLTNICKINVFKIDPNGIVSTIGSLNNQIDKQFPPQLHSMGANFLQGGISEIQIKNISTTFNSPHTESTWLIYNFKGSLAGFECVCPEITTHKEKYEHEKLTSIIYGGMAFEIPPDISSFTSHMQKSYLYSYLPIGTALSQHSFPMNINAPFIIDSNRHYLRFQDTTNTPEKQWHDAWHMGVIKHIIVPMYASLLVNLKSKGNLGLSEYFNGWELKDYYNWFYSLFPDMNRMECGQTQNSLFLFQLSKELYSLLHSTNQCLLMSEDFSEWLSFTGNTQGAFRNIPSSSIRYSSSSPAVNDDVNSILAKIKYPITSASDHITVSLSKFNLSFQTINQLHVLTFLNNHTHHLCKRTLFPRPPTKVSNSTLTFGEIVSLLKYLVSGDNACQYEVIPLKVDSLDTLGNFSKSVATFESTYSTLLTGCDSYFLSDQFPADVVQRLHLLGFLKPLDHTFLAARMNPNHFNLDQMCLFWKFILDCLPRGSSLEDNFGAMSVVPVIRDVSSQSDYLKISQLPHILRRGLHPSTYSQNAILFNILSKLDCPILDLERFQTKLFTMSAIESCFEKYKFKYSLKNVISSLGLAINCSLSNKLDSQEATSLRKLFLFSEQMNYDTDNLRIISALKMFLTITDTLVSLKDCRKCFVSREKIPICYSLLEELSRNDVSILIASTEIEKDNIVSLCRGCAIPLIESYQRLFNDYLLSNFSQLEILHQQSLLNFITTIKNIDLNAYLSIILKLKDIPFIQLPGRSEYLLVSELYSSSVKLFSSYYAQLLIPQTWLLNTEPIICELGLHYQLDLKSVKDCAIEVSTQKHGNKANSKTLLPLLSFIQLIKSSHFILGQFSEFANIAFLPLWRYQLTFQKEYKLGRFCDANLHTQQYCCSTSSWIHCPEIKIPDFNTNLTQQLEIITSPATSDVVSHLRNISNNFQFMPQLEKQIFFEKTYNYLQNCGTISLSSISGKACIFYDRTLYQARNMVFKIRDEFKPFLFKVPKELEKYSKFLTALGVEKYPTYSHYASVMKDIALSNSPATIGQYGQMVFLLLISTLRNHESNNEAIQLTLSDTYVLTQNLTCILQSNAVFIDNTKLLIHFNSFSSLANLDFLFELPPNNHGSGEPPKSLQIRYLSSIIKETLTDKTRHSPSIQTDTINEIQRILKADKFYQGLVRIYFHSTKGKGKDNLNSVRIKDGIIYDSPSVANDPSYNSIRDILCQLVVIGVNTIEVKISILQSQQSLLRNDIYQCFMENSSLYIEANSKVKDLYLDLTYLLNIYLCNIFCQNLFFLQACLTNNPDDIPLTLNSFGLSQCPYLNTVTPQKAPNRAPPLPAPSQLMTRERLFKNFHRQMRTTHYSPSITPRPTSSPRISINPSPLLSQAPLLPTLASLPTTSLQSSPSLVRTSLQPSPSTVRTSVPSSSFVRKNTPANTPSTYAPSLPINTFSQTIPSHDNYTAKLWIRTAQCDLRAAHKLLHKCEDDQSIYTAHACFYCFECAIKSCISVICLKQCYQVNISFERNLDIITDILKQFLSQDEHTRLVNLCLPLMNYNEAARDPCMTPGIGCCIPIEAYSVDAATEAIRNATDILKLVKDKFPEIELLMFNDGDNVWEHPPITSLLKTHLDNSKLILICPLLFSPRRYNLISVTVLL